MSAAVAHPNGFVPLAHVGEKLPWNAARCSCGGLRDARALSCRGCYEARPPEKRCTGCGGTKPAEQFYARKSGERLPRCKACVALAGQERRASGAGARYSAATRRRPGHYRKVAAHTLARVRTDTDFRLAYHLRRALRQALRRHKGIKKSGPTVAYLGCSIPEFRAYIEGLWSVGMSWANWGQTRDCWQIDHKRPVASFDLTDPAQVAACFHYTNMQPLWALENAAKGARWDGEVADE